MTQHSALELRSVSKTIHTGEGTQLDILCGLDLTVQVGQTVSIMGKSGSGKSTLLSLMGLLSAPTHGSVALSGTDAGPLSDAERARLRNETLGFIFQNYSLIPRWTVLQNCQLPALYRKSVSASSARRTAIRKLEDLGLADRLNAFPGQLSGGEQQRVAIARALMSDPRVILADEPTGALDSATATTVLDILTEAVATAGCSLVIVTHDDEVAGVADDQYVLASGRLDRRSAGGRS